MLTPGTPNILTIIIHPQVRFPPFEPAKCRSDRWRAFYRIGAATGMQYTRRGFKRGGAMNVFEYVFTSINGASLPLRNYQGQPLLLVNTASKCGYTPQYTKLQRIWEDYRQSGLVIIGIPSNDFGEQEPDDEDVIAEFCSSNFNVSFPMTTKQKVMGLGTHPLFVAIREEFGEDAAPRWNFFKYLFDRQGQMLGFWPSAVEPDDPVITHQIERNLQSWVL
jgi:glutathione peroxidase